MVYVRVTQRIAKVRRQKKYLACAAKIKGLSDKLYDMEKKEKDGPRIARPMDNQGLQNRDKISYCFQASAKFIFSITMSKWIIKVFRIETRYLIVFSLQRNLYFQLLCPTFYFQSEEHKSRVTQVKIMPYQTQSGMVHMHEN